MRKPKTPPIRLSKRQLDAMANMPSLSHWPHKPAKFDPELSEVYLFIRRSLKVELKRASAILKAAHAAKVVTFDRAHGLWEGTEHRKWLVNLKEGRLKSKGQLRVNPEMVSFCKSLNINAR